MKCLRNISIWKKQQQQKRKKRLISLPVNVPQKTKYFLHQALNCTGVFLKSFSKALAYHQSSLPPEKKKKKPFSRQNLEELEGSHFLTRWRSRVGNPDLCVLLTWLLLLAPAKEAELPVWFSADCVHCNSQNLWMFLLYSVLLCFVKDVVSGFLLVIGDPVFRFAAVISCDFHQVRCWFPCGTVLLWFISFHLLLP